MEKYLKLIGEFLVKKGEQLETSYFLKNPKFKTEYEVLKRFVMPEVQGRIEVLYQNILEEQVKREFRLGFALGVFTTLIVVGVLA